MQGLINELEHFNRKERFFVVGWALDNPKFTLGSTFREGLKRDTGLDVPADAFCAMDFHLDWLLGSLWVTKEERAIYSMATTGYVNRKNDDVDLIVAYDEGDTTHLLLLEAKGVTGWHNAQLRPKAKRLGELFGAGDHPDIWPGVQPHWILASRRKPQGIDLSDWPAWMHSDGQPTWLKLPLPDGLKKIVRCTEAGQRFAEGAYWKIV